MLAPSKEASHVVCRRFRFRHYSRVRPGWRGKQYEKWKYVLFFRRHGRPPRDITGLARASCMAFLAQRPWRRLNMPGGRHEGTIEMMGRIRP